MADRDDSRPTAASDQKLQAPLPLFYANGFDVNVSLSDLGLLFMYDGQPIMRLALSFTTAKTLASQLQAGIEKFEKATGQKLLTMEDVGKGYEAFVHGERRD